MLSITVNAGPYAAGSHTNISLSQSPGAGAILLNGSTVAGGVAMLDKARRVTLTSGGNDNGITFTISGTQVAGAPISETIAGGSGSTVVSVLDYLTVTSITHTGSVASTFTAGTAISGTDAPIGSSAWIRTDDWGATYISLGVDVTGTVNYTVEQSDDDPNQSAPLAVIPPASMVWLEHPVLNNTTISAQDGYTFKPKFCRVTDNSATATSGFVTMTLVQAGGKGGS